MLLLCDLMKQDYTLLFQTKRIEEKSIPEK